MDSKPRKISGVQTQYTPIFVVTGICAAIFFIGPIAVPKGQHQGLIRCCLMLTIFSLWLFWVTIYIAQMNPLVGPRMENTTLAWIGFYWKVIFIQPRESVALLQIRGVMCAWTLAACSVRGGLSQPVANLRGLDPTQISPSAA